MASRLPHPTSASKLKPPSRLPGMAYTTNVSKRLATDDPPQQSPSKRASKENMTAPLKSTMGPPPPRLPLPATRKNMRRSVSMANINVSSNLKSAARGALGSTSSLKRNTSGSSLNISGRTPSVTSKTPSTAAGRRPVTNITNQMTRNTSSSSVGTKRAAPTPAPGPATQAKRKPWDLKGQLQDKKEIIDSLIQERQQFSEKMELFEKRLNDMAHERENLSSHLSETETVKKVKMEELEEVNAKYRELEATSNATISKLKESVEDVELKLERKERQNKDLQTEVDLVSQTVVQLKKSLCDVNSSKSVIESEMLSYKQRVIEGEARIAQLEKELSDALNTIVELKEKVRTGEEMRRKLHNKVQELKGNIRVFCRVRPLLGDEITDNGGSDEIYHINILTENSLELLKDGSGSDTSSMSGLKSRGNGAAEFTYDRVFGPKDTQKDVFEEVSQLVQSALDGYNICIFAYGQTGSGKTFTMEGVPDDCEKAGIIPRTVDFIYEHITALKESGWKYTMQASFLEIYNESIRDLLVSQSEAKNFTYDIKMTDSRSPITHVSNLKIVDIEQPEDIYRVLKTAHQHRAVAATNMNMQSSRSHSVFRMVLSGTNAKTSETCQGSLNLVDLAGSERLKESGSTGARLTETQNINKSLSNLSNVIMALGQKQNHIPYRNSKLTHLLQPSLGGNSKTLMLVNVSPLDACANETLNSLRFASKVNACHIGTASKQAKKV